MAGEKDGRLAARRRPVALWCAWAAALMAVPVFRQSGDVAGGLYALAALGVLVGLACARPLGRAAFDSRAGRAALRAVVVAGAAACIVSFAFQLGWWLLEEVLGLTVQTSPFVLFAVWLWTEVHPVEPALALLSGLACGLALRPCLRAAGVGDAPAAVPLRPLACALVTLAAVAALRPYALLGIYLPGFDLPRFVLLLPTALVRAALATSAAMRSAARLVRAGVAPGGAHARVGEAGLVALLAAALCAGELAGKWVGYAASLTASSLFDLALLILPPETGGPGAGLVPLDVSTLLSLALYALSTLALLALPAALGRSRRATDGPGAAVPAPGADDPGLAALVSRGLTEREAQAVRALLDGLSSREAAERLGLGASTVRNYQQRAYRKLGVADARAARELLAGEVPAAAPVPGEGDAASATPVPSVPCRRALRAAAALLACLLLLPFGAGRELAWWVPGQLAVCAGGGLALAAALFALDAARARGVVVPGRDAPVARPRAERAALVVSAAVALACRLALPAGGPSWLPIAIRLALAIAMPALVALTLRRVARALAARPGALPIVARSALGSPWVLALTCLAVALLGAVWEELWRSRVWTDFSLYPQALPFTVAALGACAAVTWLRLGREARALSIGSAALSLAALAAEGWEVAALLCVLLHGAVLVWGLARAPRDGVPAEGPRGAGALLAAALCASAAAGMVAGMLVVNRYASAFTVEANMFRAGFYDYERLVAFTSSASYVMGAVFLVCGCGLVVAARHLVTSVDAARLMEGVRVVPERRLRAFLVSRGLSDLQVDVALLTAEGLSTRQIGERLHYAPGTVGSVRLSCYRALGVHDRAQLVAVLSGVAG